MKTQENKEGIWFIFDGDCPLCKHAAEAMEMKKRYGELFLVDARNPDAQPHLFEEIRKRKLNLDEGMVILYKEKFYHGGDALRFIAKHRKSRNIIDKVFYSIFRSQTISILSYPFIRGVRNTLLKALKIKPIENMNSPTKD